MFRYFSFTRGKNYSDVLQDLVDSYNNIYHRSINTKPSLVNKDNEKCIFSNLYGLNENIDFKFSIVSYVRIVEKKSLFQKGYTPNWSRDIYIISNQINSVPSRYSVKNIGPSIINLESSGK